jgi:hypothetical protein
MQLTEEEDQEKSSDDWGNSKYSYHLAQGEAEICVADAATTEAGQPAETVREALEQIWKLPKKKRRMSILRSGSMLSARKLRKLQH